MLIVAFLKLIRILYLQVSSSFVVMLGKILWPLRIITVHASRGKTIGITSMFSLNSSAVHFLQVRLEPTFRLESAAASCNWASMCALCHDRVHLVRRACVAHQLLVFREHCATGGVTTRNGANSLPDQSQVGSLGGV